MPILNFKKQFAAMVEDGTKRCTIRARRKDGRNPKPGQTLYLYTGLRTKGTRKLGEVKCKSSEPICIDSQYGVVIGIKHLNHKELADLARRDGFETLHDFFEFFAKEHGPLFFGFLIEW